MKLLGLILSGGRSSRMGTNKGLMHYQGKAMVEYSISLLRQLTNDIVISTADTSYEKFGIQLIPDEIPDLGPIGGLYSVINQTLFDIYFVVPCDMPYASPELAKTLLSYAKNYDIVIPASNSTPEPLFGIYSRKILPVIENQINFADYKMQNLLNKCNTYLFKIDESIRKKNPLLFKNINSPEDAETRKQ